MKLLRRTLALCLLLSVMATCTLTSCMKEEDYYTRNEVIAMSVVLENAMKLADEEHTTALVSLTEEYTATKEELADADESNRQSISALTAAYTTTLDELRAEDARATAELIAFETENAQHMQLLRDEIHARELAHDALVAEYEATVAELDRQSADNADAIRHLTQTYERDLANLQASGADTAEALEALTDRYEATLARLKSEDAALQQQLTDQAKAHREDIDRIDGELSELRESLASVEEELQTLTARVDTLSTEIEQLGTEYDEQLSVLKQRAVDLDAAIRACEASYTQRINELTVTHTTQINELRALIEDLTDTYAALIDEHRTLIEELTVTHTTQANEHRTLIEELRSVLHAQSPRLDALEAAVEDILSYPLKRPKTSMNYRHDVADATDYAVNATDFYTSVKKGLIISLSVRPKADFSSAVFAFGGSGITDITLSDLYIEITPTHLNVRTIGGGAITSLAHGLSVSEDVPVSLVIENDISTGRIRLSTAGEVFTYDVFFCLQTLCRPMLRVRGGASQLSLSIGCKDLTKDIWLFGDSYFTNDPYRWIYYLYEDGYADNCLIDAYAGERSELAMGSFQNSLTYGTPTYAVFCLGMNDADSEEGPNVNWKRAVDRFISTCNANGIIPILTTIPSTPIIDNSKKNAYVKESGYRYIDFAAAVQNEGERTWFDGLLYDNIHPTDKGAQALYFRFLLDFPEITYR